MPSRVRLLTSSRNPELVEIRRALREGKPTGDGLIVIEGPHLLAEALRSQVQITKVLTTSEAAQRYEKLISRTRANTTETSPKVFAQLATTVHSQEILALVQMPVAEWALMSPANQISLIVALDGIQDPGNAGTIVRSAEAFGASGVVLLQNSVRISNSKFLRASAGSIFRLPFLEGRSAAELVDWADRSDVRMYALEARGAIELRQANLRAPCVLIVGSEGVGVRDELRSAAAGVRIPTRNVESLNAAIACSLALYEAHHQRERP